MAGVEVFLDAAPGETRGMVFRDGRACSLIIHRDDDRPEHRLGARVVGRPMAGLLGAVYDLRLPNSGLVIKIPVERLYAVDGTPREQFKPQPD